MTAGVLIAIADELRPNHYSVSQKLRWLERIDARIKRELYDKHEAHPGAAANELAWCKKNGLGGGIESVAARTAAPATFTAPLTTPSISPASATELAWCNEGNCARSSELGSVSAAPTSAPTTNELAWCNEGEGLESGGGSLESVATAPTPTAALDTSATELAWCNGGDGGSGSSGSSESKGGSLMAAPTPATAPAPLTTSTTLTPATAPAALTPAPRPRRGRELELPYDEQTELLAPFPFDEALYTAYLFTHIDLNNAEIGKYDQSAALFEAAWRQFADAYNTSHMPRGVRAFDF